MGIGFLKVVGKETVLEMSWRDEIERLELMRI
jgi:hypothetical protein